MNIIEKLTSMRVCAIMIYKKGCDKTQVRFWAQVLGCKENELQTLVDMTKTLDHKIGGDSPTDDFLLKMWDILKEKNAKECKIIFNSFRNGEYTIRG